MPPILKCPFCKFCTNNRTSFSRHKVRLHSKTKTKNNQNQNPANVPEIEVPPAVGEQLVEEIDYEIQNDSNDDNFEQALTPPHEIDFDTYQLEDLKLQTFQQKISTLITPSVDSSSIKSGIELLLKTNWVHGINNNNNHGAPLFNDVMDIFDFVSQNSLTIPQGDGILLLIKKILLRHPTYEEVYIHTKFRSISSLLNKVLNGIYNMSVTHIPLPVELRGGDCERKQQESNRILNPDNHNPEFIIASGFSINLMELISEILVTTSLDSIDFNPVYDIDEASGSRKFSSFATCDLYHHLFSKVQMLYGNDAYPFCIQWSQDATITSGGGGATKYEIPCYIRALQIKDDAFYAKTNELLLGLAPKFNVTLATLKAILAVVVRPSESIRKQTITYLEETIRHRYIVAVTAQLLKIQQSGGVFLNVGKKLEGNQTKIKIVPILIGFALDNQEAFKIQSTRGSFKCPSSCRFCTMPNKEMYKFRVLHEILFEEKEIQKRLRRQQRRRINNNGIDEEGLIPLQLKSNGDILWDYINRSKAKFHFRDAADSNHQLTQRSEKSWFKFILHDASQFPRGQKQLQRTSMEINDIALTVSRTIQPWINPLRDIFPLLTQSHIIDGIQHNLLLSFDLLVPPDKLHTHDKGIGSGR